MSNIGDAYEIIKLLRDDNENYVADAIEKLISQDYMGLSTNFFDDCNRKCSLIFEPVSLKTVFMITSIKSKVRKSYTKDSVTIELL